MNCGQLYLFPGPERICFALVVHMIPQRYDPGRQALWKKASSPYELHRFDTGKPMVFSQVISLL